jgi:signal transduction histidine kinase/CheY-like chemotaxis protein
VRPDGDVRWVVARVRTAQHGERRVLFGVLIDVTDQRLTQQRLRRAEQRTLLAAKAVGLASWEHDLVERVAWWDTQMYLLRGLSPDDPRPAHELHLASVHPDDSAMVRRRFAGIVERETDFLFEFRVLRPDGAVRWLATRGSVSRDEHWRAQRLFGFEWDVTEHKIAEDVRREKAAAEEANRAKSEFLSRMSHELRTPLNAVIGFAQLLLDDPRDDRRLERAGHIRDAGRHLLALIDDVLDLTSVEVGAVPLELQVVALEPLVHESLQWVAPAAAAVRVSLHAGPLDTAVHADPRRLRQVLANLLSNAVKYNRPGGRVDVGLVEGADGAEVGLSVRDTGRGLTHAQMLRLFEPFNRLGAEREDIEGTGIGLTIVRALAEAMGGRVEVRSAPGEGSEFRVWLRSSRDAAEPAEPAAAAAAAAEDGPAQPMDVLYIEDNPVNVLLVEELVSLRPHVRLHVAVDGRTGIARARELRPRVVLIDLQLPDIDGFDVLRAVRADPALAGIACIALSANAMREDVARALRSGFDDYWTKPIDFAQFLGGLDNLSRASLAPSAVHTG